MCFRFFLCLFSSFKAKKRGIQNLKSPHCRSYLCVLSAAQNTPKKRKGPSSSSRRKNAVVQLEEEEALEGSTYSLVVIMSHTSFGKKATELVKEISVSIETSASPSSIPPYNDELVRSILEEVKAHHREMLSLLRKLENAEEKTEKRSISAAMETHHFSILRNKKALMIYLNERAKRIQSLRWTLGVGLPDSISENLSHSERDYFTRYSKILNKYMGKKDGINMNLTLDRDPPKEHKVQVRCLKDNGETYFKDGVVDLRKDTVHLLWREEAQELIREGVLEKLDDA